MKALKGLSKAEKGVAIVVALLAMLVMSILGISLLFTTKTEDLVARNYAAEVDALFAANSGVHVGLRHALIDFIYDPLGGWSDNYLAIGSATTPPMPPGLKGPGVLLDGSGQLTGRVNTYYYDLKPFNGLTPGPATDAAWFELMARPYSLPTHDEQVWPGPLPKPAADSWFPNNAYYKIWFQGVPVGSSAGNSNKEQYKKDRIRILSEGRSGRFLGGITWTTTGEKATRQVYATFRIKDIGIWGNAFYAASASGPDFLGKCDIRGSIHILNPTNDNPAWELSGSQGIRNNYSDMPQNLALHLPVPPGDPHSLNAEVRVRNGGIKLANGKVSVGTGSDGNASPNPPLLYPGKGPMDGIFLGPPGTVTGPTSGFYADIYDQYDAAGFQMGYPEYEKPYTDKHPGAHTFNSYEEFIIGKGDGSGIHALDMTPLNDDLSFPESSAKSKSPPGPVWYTVKQAAGTFLGVPAGNLVFVNTHDYPLVGGLPFVPNPATWMDNSTCSKVPRGVNCTDVPCNVDVLVDKTGTSQVVGVFKHVPSQIQNPASTCIWEGGGGGHGFLWIPEEGGVILDPAGDIKTSDQIWDFVQRNFAQYDADSFRYDPPNGYNATALRSFLGMANRGSPIRTYPDLNGNGAKDGIEGKLGRLLVMGNIHMRNFKIELGTAKNSDRGDICYMGKASFSTGPVTATGKTIVFNCDEWFIPMRTFPCDDNVGMMAVDTAYEGDLGNATQVKGALTIYGSKTVVLNHNPEVAGAIVSKDVQPGSPQANSVLDQVPAVIGCLPPNMIGDWHYYITRTVSWSEH